MTDILEINRRMISRFGGIYFTGDRNLANPGSLAHVLEEIQGSLFGHEPYPTVIEKAAAIGWRIITAHVFHDGKKRTAMEACRLYLEINGHTMHIDREVVQIALQVAKREVEFDDFVEWIRRKTTQFPTR